MKNYKMLIFLGLLLVVVFFSYPVIITYDTAHYHTYLDILNGLEPWENWDVVRGLVFPLFINLIYAILGKSMLSVLIVQFILYLISMFFSHKIICELLPDDFFKNKNRSVYYVILFSALIIFNPLILGYYHVLLTEFLSTTIMLSVLYNTIVCYKKVEENTLGNNDILMYGLYFPLMAIIMWHLKQPYVLLVIVPTVMITLFASKKNVKKNIRVFLLMLNPILLVSLMVSIMAWSAILPDKGAAGNYSRSSEGILGTQIIAGAINFKVLEKQPEYWLVYDNLKKVEYKFPRNGTGIGDSFKYILSCFKNNPTSLISGYIDGYYGLINFYAFQHTDNLIGGTIMRQASLIRAKENSIIGFKIFRLNSEENVFHMPEELRNRISMMEFKGNTNHLLNQFFLVYGNLFNCIYTIFGLIYPFVIVCFILFMKRIKSTHKFILLTMLFLYGSFACAFVFLNGIIDRYLFSMMFVIMILLISMLCRVFIYGSDNNKSI